MVRRVLIISLVYHPEFIGGAEIATREITDRLNGYAFDMITLRGGSPLSEEIVGNIRVFRVGWKSNTGAVGGKILFSLQKYLFPFMVFWKGSSLIKKNRYDVIWSIMANYAGFGALFLKLKFPSIKFLLTLQEGDPIPYIKRRVFFVYPLFKMIFKRADAVQAISNYLADFAISMKAKNVTVIPNGVDIKNFTREYDNEVRDRIRKEIRAKEGDIFLVTTSRLVLKNGVADVIRAMGRLPMNYKFLIIGDGKLEASLKNLVSDLNLTDRVIFLGFVHQADISKYFSVSQIFIRTSLSEGLGNSFLEAMAFGLPVVATPVGGIVDFLEDGVTGVSVRPGDADSIAEGIMRLSDENLVARLKAAGQSLVLKKYDWGMIATKFDGVLNNI